MTPSGACLDLPGAPPTSIDPDGGRGYGGAYGSIPSHQYVNHPDPVEREARIQRVLETNAQGIMEETAARIIVSATTQSPAQQLICFQPEGRIYRSTG